MVKNANIVFTPCCGSTSYLKNFSGELLQRVMKELIIPALHFSTSSDIFRHHASELSTYCHQEGYLKTISRLFCQVLILTLYIETSYSLSLEAGLGWLSSA